ncbi:Divergent AAA domain protein [Stieleria bergensis]|uniref:Divergent AAA domain protein n=2 Tax=Stieleria TaxID=2795973 RepID=A0A517STK5_9BACT|nr:ATP-binding protein [Stieleria varia]QDT59458.1 Divergent AAA domain protein [Planctomycetes bacterium SV_7m_r]TWU08373.1 Divergent AAA domain protein [Stieleria varia]
MAELPINIEDLLRQRTVEGERIEYKTGWNPAPIMRTLCAFANDFENLGGGYVVIGQDCDESGRPVFPPAGVPEDSLDRIQQELLRYCNQIQPPYFPILSIQTVENRNLIVLWAPGGQNRPYSVPRDVTASHKEKHYYIRRYSSTVQVVENSEDQRELLSLTATVPFDDRQCQRATIDDLKISLIRSYLNEVGSDLLSEVDELSLVNICRQMQIVDGGDEVVRPRNIGVLFFSNDPAKFLPGAQIDVVIFPDGAGGDELIEKTFEGPIDQQIRSALRYVQNEVVVEKVIKLPDRPEAKRFFNYPLAAIEEALVNAMYHRGYDTPEPVEVRVNPDRIEIVSYPGPDPSIRPEHLRDGLVVARRYRNRRIGEFFKELELTEGRGTGIPKIKRVMVSNGSPEPSFSTDDIRSHFLVVLPMHREFSIDSSSDELLSLSAMESNILEILESGELGRSELADRLGVSSRAGSMKRAIDRLIDVKLIEFTLPETPRSPNQRLRLPARKSDS